MDEIQQSIREIQEWQKEHRFERKPDTPKNIEQERKRLERECVQIVVSLLNDNVEQWESESEWRIVLKNKNYEFEVGEYRLFTTDDYRIKIFSLTQTQRIEIFDYSALVLSSERKAIKKALKKAYCLKKINDMQSDNESLLKSLDELRSAL